MNSVTTRDKRLNDPWKKCLSFYFVSPQNFLEFFSTKSLATVKVLLAHLHLWRLKYKKSFFYIKKPSLERFWPQCKNHFKLALAALSNVIQIVLTLFRLVHMDEIFVKPSAKLQALVQAYLPCLPWVTQPK